MVQNGGGSPTEQKKASKRLQSKAADGAICLNSSKFKKWPGRVTLLMIMKYKHNALLVLLTNGIFSYWCSTIPSVVFTSPCPDP